MTEYPKIEDFIFLHRYLDLLQELVNSRGQEQEEEICRKMMTYTRDAMREAEVFNKQLAQASKENLAACGIESREYRPAITISTVPYKRYAIICEKNGEIGHAVWACRQAISLGLDYDGTKAGMKGRLERLLKKAGS